LDGENAKQQTRKRQTQKSASGSNRCPSPEGLPDCIRKQGRNIGRTKSERGKEVSVYDVLANPFTRYTSNP
jgi:hypothetical protein